MWKNHGCASAVKYPITNIWYILWYEYEVYPGEESWLYYSMEFLGQGGGGGEMGSLSASFVLADWRVRVFRPSVIVDRPSKFMYVNNIPLSGCMDKCYHNFPFFFLNMTT